MGESRQELLTWLTDLLQWPVTKVEYCGTGAFLAQVYDSIYMDVPLSRLKWEPKTEYEYLNNFKVVQNCLTKHQVDRPIPVQQLVKCKMQDNLEFLQWTKRFWDNTFGGGDYDAVARRQRAGLPGTPNPSSGHAAASRGYAPKRGTTPTAASAPVRGPIRSKMPAHSGVSSAKVEALEEENAGLKEAMTNLERERDFYFSKLRDIELLVQQAVELDPEIEKDEEGLVKNVQAILYSTEEGFEVPNEDEEGHVAGQDDLETF
ncbi:MAG: hypothetical protein M4579_006021 [Chaenotheca gracillima]|nr:MAG: hypothetical protein M4579_006021 [Chaenotheca gracillima]